VLGGAPAELFDAAVATPGVELPDAQRYLEGQDPLFSRHGAVRLTVEFPTGRIGRAEPLVVTGAEGRGDLLSVEYLDARHLRFVYDHWGAAAIRSGRIEIVPGRKHVLTVRFGGLLAGRTTPVTELAPLKRLRVVLDEAEVMNVAAEFHLADADELHLGANRIGGSTCEPRFTGNILQAERLTRPASAHAK
jgi:hypothetical protein